MSQVNMNKVNGRTSLEQIVPDTWAVAAANQISDAMIECVNRMMMLRFGMKADAEIPAAAREAAAKCIQFHYREHQLSQLGRQLRDAGATDEGDKLP